MQGCHGLLARRGWGGSRPIFLRETSLVLQHHTSVQGRTTTAVVRESILTKTARVLYKDYAKMVALQGKDIHATPLLQLIPLPCPYQNYIFMSSTLFATWRAPP